MGTKLHPGTADDVGAHGRGKDYWDSLVRNHLAEMGTGYVDALMLHFPGSSTDKTVAAWRFLERGHRAGLALALGVSNLNRVQLADLWAWSTVKPSFQQVRWTLYEPAEAELSG